MKAVPDSIRSKIVDRLKGSVNSQKMVMDKVLHGRPLDAEPNLNRKLAYIQKVLDVGSDIARRIADYEDPKDLPISPIKQSKAESIQGSTVDFLDICFLDKARAASRSVARVAFRNGDPQGTGFMVSPNLFLTNQHVIQDKHQAKNFYLEFNYELDLDRNALPFTRFKLDPDKLFLSDPEDDLDFSLIAVGDRVDGPLSLEEFGYLPLINSIDKHIRAMFVNVVQHPEGRHKQLVVRENRILYDSDNTLIYGSDTLPGASGSPVFNDDWEVVGLHHWGEPYRAVLDSTTNSSEGLPQNGNEGIRISSIVKHLNSEVGKITSFQAALLKEALNPGFRAPSLMSKKSLSEKNPKASDKKTYMGNQSNPQIGYNPQVASNGTVTWTIPLTVSVQLGGVQQPIGEMNKQAVNTEGFKENEISAGAESFKPDSDYHNRKGYDPNFLGIKVNLPKLSDTQKQIAAKNNWARQGEDPFELKYQHFSIVMNAEQKLAYFTAVNIDGASVIQINRKTGKIGRIENPNFEAAEAYEKWFDDDRIKATERTDQSLYNDPQMKDYQRGHLVKRTDPSWGNPERGVRGQADTFHFTNCAPQHEGFNPVTSRWAGVENWITNESDKLNIRVTVFTGPVFGDKEPDNGPIINGIQIPMRFWKVIVWVEDGKLQATGILADQSDLVKGSEADNGGENIGVLPEDLVKVEQCSIKYIEDITGLDFGILGSQSLVIGNPKDFGPEDFDSLISRFSGIKF